jgi:hypothetical protein
MLERRRTIAGLPDMEGVRHPHIDPFRQEAADPTAPLDIAVSVGADAVVREIALPWGPDAWRYVVTYSALGSTPGPVVPANAKSLRELWRPVPPSVAAPGSGS